MTPDEASAQADQIEAEIHELLDIIGTDPIFEATRIRLCRFITDLGCEPHSACGGGST